MQRAAELIAEGLSDQKIADAVGLQGSAGRMLVSRHRRFHVLAPAAAVVEAAGKGRANVEQRQQLVAAAEGGDAAAAFLGLHQIAADLRRVQERLERTADAAEVDKQRLAVASLSRRSSFERRRSGPSSVGLAATRRSGVTKATPRPLC
jgi:hypothetical protein